MTLTCLLCVSYVYQIIRHESMLTDFKNNVSRAQKYEYFLSTMSRENLILISETFNYVLKKFFFYIKKSRH